MSTMNMCAPPQTYSRLFRPWDTKMENSEIDIRASTASRIKMMKTEYCSASEAMDSENIDIMNSEASELAHTDSEDNECSSSNSSGDCSINPIFDDCESDVLSFNTPPPSSSSSSLSSSSSSASASVSASLNIPSATMRNSLSFPDGQLRNTNLYGSSAQCFQNYDAPHMQHQHQHPISPSQHYHHPQLTMFSGIAPTANGGNNSFYYAAAAAAAAAVANNVNMPTTLPNFNIDPYPLGLMEQEYARVMAEEAHIKALNARKQRPKKFKCPHCDVAFSNNGQLKGHIRIHTGERPFKCDAESCGKTFTRNEELTRHKRIHTGLRPFPCGACGKKFGRRDHLKKHMKTHMPQEHPLGGSATFFMPMYPYMYGL